MSARGSTTLIVTKRLAVLLLALCMAGCSPTAEPRGIWGKLWGLEVGPDYKRPEVRPVEQYRAEVGPSEAHSLADLPWWRVFNEPNLTMHNEPTVCEVDYPVLGILRAQNDMVQGVLDVETTAATPSRRGTPTHFRVKGLSDPASVVVTADDQEFTQWDVSASDSIRIETDVDEHHFRIVFRSTSPAKKAHRIVQEISNTAESNR